MQRWEYLTLRIAYDRKTHKNWVSQSAGGSPLIGLRSILTHHGDLGWELVSLDPVDFRIQAEFGRYYMDPAVYRATFKRLA